MIDRIYGLASGISSGLEEAKYRFHLKVSGLNLPSTRRDFNVLGCGDEMKIDYSNFPISIARHIGHMLGHQEGLLYTGFFPPEDYFNVKEAEGLRSVLKDETLTFEVMVDARRLKDEIMARIVEVQMTGNSKTVVEKCNEAIEFYRNKLLPESKRVWEVSAKYWKDKKPEIVKEYSRKLKTTTPIM